MRAVAWGRPGVCVRTHQPTWLAAPLACGGNRAAALQPQQPGAARAGACGLPARDEARRERASGAEGRLALPPTADVRQLTGLWAAPAPACLQLVANVTMILGMLLFGLLVGAVTNALSRANTEVTK